MISFNTISFDTIYCRSSIAHTFFSGFYFCKTPAFLEPAIPSLSNPLSKAHYLRAPPSAAHHKGVEDEEVYDWHTPGYFP